MFDKENSYVLHMIVQGMPAYPYDFMQINYSIKIEFYQKVKNCNNIFYKLKNVIDNRITKIGSSAGYMKALILGDDSGIPSDITDIYQRISISHLFAISGMHISIFTGILLFFLKKVIRNEKASYFIIILFYCLIFCIPI